MAPTKGSQSKTKTTTKARRTTASTTTVSKETLLAIVGQVSSLHGGNGGAPRDVVCRNAGYSSKPQGFQKAISRLIQSGHLERGNGGVKSSSLLVLTAKSVEVAGTVEPPASNNKQQIEQERDQLSGGNQVTIFDSLLEATSAKLSRSELRDKVPSCPTIGAFNKTLSRMKTAGCLDCDKDHAWLTDRVFPFGRP